MSSAAKAELGALYTTAKEMAPLCQTLIKMGWLQPRTPIQTDNSTAASPTSPLSHIKPSQWTSVYGGYTAKNLKNIPLLLG
jgi:hypothetical protein